MEKILVAVSKVGLKEEDFDRVKAIAEKRYASYTSFKREMAEVLKDSLSPIKVMVGSTENWARFLNEDTFKNQDYLFFTVPAIGSTDEML